MLKDIFTLISNQLKTNISWVKSVDMYFLQDTNPEKSLGFKSPYIMIDFQNINFENMSNSIQQCTCDVVVKIMIEDYTRNQLNIFNYRLDVVQALYNFAPEQFSLQHNSERTNSGSTNMYEYEITFQCNFYEDFSYVYSEEKINFNIQLIIDSLNDTVINGFASTSGTGTVNVQHLNIDDTDKLITNIDNIAALLLNTNWDIDGTWIGASIHELEGKFYSSVDYFYFFVGNSTPVRTLKG